jgi:hypothetical protein
MYIDGHKQEDMVAYCNQFIMWWKQYEARFLTFDNDRHPHPPPDDFLDWTTIVSSLDGFSLPTALSPLLILVTHNKSTFYQNDGCQLTWSRKGTFALPKLKGNGQLLMISDFLTAKWGPLQDDYGCIATDYTYSAYSFSSPDQRN